MCLHSAYEAGGVVYVRALATPASTGTDPNSCSRTDDDEPSLGSNRRTDLDGRREDRYTAPTRRSQSSSRPSASPQRKPT